MHMVRGIEEGMTTPELNPRLNVSAPLTGAPTGDFAIAATLAVPAPGKEGAAIISRGAAAHASAATVDAVSKFLNLDVPIGKIAAVADSTVKADGDLAFSVSSAVQADPAAVIETTKIAGCSAETPASLNLGAPKFTY
jgi:hypothetical protein